MEALNNTEVVAALQDVLAMGAQARLRVRGSSMLPTLREDDCVLVEPLDVRLEPGMVVVARDGDRLLIHRLVSVANESVQTRGDFRGEPDPRVPTSALIGRVVARERNGRVIPLRGRALLVTRITRFWVRATRRIHAFLTPEYVSADHPGGTLSHGSLPSVIEGSQLGSQHMSRQP